MKNYLQLKSARAGSLNSLKKTNPGFAFFFILMCSLFGSVQNASSQTTLAPGDIALLGINASTTDQFYWTITKPITTGTVIYFTDNGYTSTTAGRTGEGFISFTAASNYPAGTVFTWTNGATVSGEYASLVGGTANAPTNFSFNASGDQLFIYQSSTALNSTNAPTTWAANNQSGLTIIYGINYGAALLTSGSGAAGTTYQPSTSILASASFVNFSSTSANNLYYTTNGSSATAVSLFQSASGLYSELTNTTRFVTSSSALTFPVRYIFAIGSLTAVNTTYGTASPIPTSFQVTARGLTNNISIAALSPFQYSTTVGGTYSGTLTLTQSGGSVNTSVFVRLAATATVVGSPYSGNIGFSSTGAQSFNVPTVSSSVAAATVTINPNPGQSKIFGAADPVFTYTATPAVSVTGSMTRIPGEGAGTYPYALGTLTAGSNYTLSLNNTLTNRFSIIDPTDPTITASTGTGGSISPSGAVSITYGANQTFNITANSCFSVADVLVDGGSVGAVTTYTFNNVTTNHTISAAFTQNTNTITASAGTGGSISPNGLTTVNCGSNSTAYTITANSGFTISDVLVNGVSQGANSSYTFTNITNNQNISASFAAITPTVTLSVSANAGTEAGTTAITVTATASSAVSGNQTVALTVSGTDVTAGDYSLSNTTITILSGQTTGSVTFTVTNDTLAESTETATLTISNPSAGITLGTTLTQSVAITDNDTTSLNIDLSTYVRVGRYDLPEPTRSAHPSNNLLCQEASAVTYDWDTDSLFITGDGSTAIVQVSKTGVLINSMTLAQGSSPQGTDFYDTEGLTYIGNNQFVMSEERDRQLVLFTYAAGTTLTRSNTQTVKLGTFVNNTGTEGLSYDPLTGGYIVLKEIDPIGIFQTNVNFSAGTATNGSATTENSVNLFNPALLNVSDVADVFALSNIPVGSGPLSSNLIVLSQEAAKVINVDRNGVIANSLQIVSDPGNPLNAASQQHEGITMDRNGFLYIVNENGGGDIDHPQLWVYAPSTAQNQAPTALALTNTTPSILENTGTTNPIKVADILVTDDGLGTNNYTVSGTDAAFFEITGTGLYIKAGTVLDYETKTAYSVTVNVDDSSVGSTPDASVNFVLSVIDIAVETPQTASVTISEVAAWGSGNSPVGADWFEVTNNATTALNITGWKVDDSSNSFASAIALSGITSIAPGESVIFMEATASLPGSTIIPAFKTLWFGSNPPAGLQIGTYQGSGIGLSTGGDALNLYNGSGVLQANVVFGTSPTTLYKTFNNAVGLNNATITLLSEIGVNDAFAALNDSSEIGSPGLVGHLFISEVSPWSSGNSPVAADWFEVTNTKAVAVDITGWKIDDNSQSPAGAVALSGITSINPGESVIFIETNDLAGKTAAFLNNWFGTNPSSGLRIGNYTGSGVGLGTGGDQVNLYNSNSVLQTSVLFGTSPATAPYTTFDNKAGVNSLVTPITQFSAVGINGAFIAANSPSEIGSPGTIITTPCPTITATATPASSTVCAGSTTTVSVTALGGTLPYTITGSPLTVGGGTFNYTVTDAKGCTTTASTTVSVQTAPNAGTDGTLTICAGSTVTLAQLNAAITGEDAGGSWTPALAGAGTYTYIVNATSPCTVADTSTVVVTAQAGPNAGNDGVYTICSGTNITLAQLQAAITGEDVGGTWTPALGGAGTYTYTVAATSPCTIADTSTVIVTAVSCAATQLSNCGNIPTLTSVNTRIFAANTITTAQTYRYRVAVSTAPTTYFYATTTYPSFRLTDVVGLTPTYGTTYNVEIQNEFLISGNTITSAYGPLCTVTTQAVTNITVPTNQCNQTLSAINSKIYVNGVTGATMYTYRVAKASAPTTYSYIDSPYSNFRLTNTPTSGTVTIEHNTVYLVAVSVTTSNGASNFNSECNITTPAGPSTTMQGSQCGDDDNPYVIATSSTKVYATDTVSGATYTFKLEQFNGATLVDTNYATSPVNYFNTNMFTGENSLLPNTNYHVSVAINYYGEGEFGHDCVIRTPAALKHEEMTIDFTAVAYPNPFANNFMIDVKSSSQSSVDLKVYDMIGRLIDQKEVRVSDLETTTLGDRYPSGVYNVVVSQENSIKTVRVVKR